MRKYLLLLLMSIFFLFGCSSEPDPKEIERKQNVSKFTKFEGYIIEKREFNEKMQILVVEGITKEDIEKRSEQELKEIAKNDQGKYFSIKSIDEFKNFQTGQKVIAYLEKNQMAAYSNPPQTKANKIEIVSE
jgi:PBP1b-binding outer membrane lipoprotein LpoB